MDPDAGPEADGTDTYPEDYPQRVKELSAPSARVIAPVVVGFLKPSSVVDVGCGLGHWLAAFQDSGVTDVIGIDSEQIDLSQLGFDPELFIALDLAKPFELNRTFDLAVCLEVGEHLAAASAAVLVSSLAGLAPLVLWSAAIPHQGGHGHVNEQWTDYWAALFAQNGFEPVDGLRQLFWSDERVESFYAQNILLFVRSDRRDLLDGIPELTACFAPPPSYVHPDLYLRYVAAVRTGPSGREALRIVARKIARRLRLKR
jgi:SAM-dependent methyltransferase